MKHGHTRTQARPETRGGGPRREGKGHSKRLFEYGELRLLILAMIAEQPRHGYEIIKEIETRFDGAYTPSPGVIYPTLSWLEDMGYVDIAPNASGRKLSTITAEGRAFLEANGDAVAELRTRRIRGKHRKEVPGPILAAMDEIKAALRQRMAGQTPDADQVTELAETLRQTARRIAGTGPQGAAQTKGRDMEQIITRHRHEIKRRTLTVCDTDYLTPHMIRMTLEGPDLEGFTSLGFDDHIKLFFGDEMRDYTPRRFDAETGTLVLDFAVHDAGPATAWAVDAKPGDSLNIGGPRGSAVIAPIFDWYLLIGDETALPAIGRRVEELAKEDKVITLAAVPGAEDEQHFFTEAYHDAHWVHRPVAQAADPAPLLEATKALKLPEGRGFVWIAAEAQVARALKTHMLTDRGHPGPQLKASGYWVAGTAGESDKSLD